MRTLINLSIVETKLKIIITLKDITLRIDFNIKQEHRLWDVVCSSGTNSCSRLGKDCRCAFILHTDLPRYFKTGKRFFCFPQICFIGIKKTYMIIEVNRPHYKYYPMCYFSKSYGTRFCFLFSRINRGRYNCSAYLYIYRLLGSTVCEDVKTDR